MAAVNSNTCKGYSRSLQTKFKATKTLTINSLQEFKHLALSDDLDADSLIFGLFVAVTDRHIDQT